MEQVMMTENSGAVAMGGIVPKAGWSWGAFGLHFSFLIAVKKYQYLWWYLLSVIPFLNIIFLIAFSIYLGVNGHKIAASGTQFSNQSEYDGYMKGTDHAGKVMFFVGLIIGGVAMIAVFAAVLLGLVVSHR